MSYVFKPLDIFLEQVKKLPKKEKEQLKKRLELIRQNPFRHKRIHSTKYTRVFRARMKIQKKETRLIYAVIEPNIILVCFLDRGKDYKDLEKYLAKIRGLK
ncbi:MAG: hypothetical protein KAW41_00405 [Candidatus Diapherotrites archaeon]|nr:hypothetical protein [Candidatus Diapherotrites archaeon]